MEAKNILVADDDSAIRKMLGKILKKEGYQVFAASDGKAAVEIAKKNPIHVAILDIKMPVLNGIDVLKRIKALEKHIEILILTGHGNLNSLRQSFGGNGVFDYILKPFERAEILDAVRNALIKQDDTYQNSVFGEQPQDRITQLEREFRERTQQLRESQIKYKELVQKAGSIIIKFDINGQITFANQFAEAFFGYAEDKMIGRHVIGTIVPKKGSSGSDPAVMIEDIIQSPENYTNIEYENIRKDGNRVWIAWSNKPIFDSEGHMVEILSIGHDKTDKKRTDEALQKAHLEMNHLISSLSSILIGLSTEHKITRWNLEAEKIFNRKNEAVLGRALADLNIQWDWNLVKQGIIKCQKENRPIKVDDVPFVRLDGKDGYLGFTMNPIIGESAGFMGVTIFGADITERKILECQLVQSQKLESIGQLAAGIAHEINTPTQYVGDNILFLKDSFDQLMKLQNMYQDFLTAFKSGDVSDDLLQRVEATSQEIDLEFLTAEIPVAIEQTQEGVARIAEIVRAMKEFSHPGCEEKTAIDINKAIENTVTVARNEWKYVSEIVTDFDPGMPFVPCLPGEFNQVILNMVINAAHAIGDVVGDGSKGKGTITISTRHDENWAEIRIKDTGSGVPEKIRSRIFDPFFTTKTIGKGTGQGLTISHSVIVDKHGGALSFESEIGKGTTFIIRLPLSNDSRT